MQHPLSHCSQDNKNNVQSIKKSCTKISQDFAFEKISLTPSKLAG